MSLLIALAVLAAAPAQAVQPATSASDAEEEMVCKYQSRTATRFKKKICHTRAVWEEMSENAKRQAQQDFNKPTISIEKGN
ncbi:hypothetical protein OK349_08315 [Sphingomonas sp. BT-65]|uniref:hypothetical protein n=1 Tax=Sphingomonas sp. BT-65 TaxID=2989821 RepID=UPI0022360AF7|nr:hypothetical protein [Sphingomonas sp. BT-65]MCW4461711.1 hypothetical protein [Sphingomonas sp. BT-65]